jgi:drug/metabolite transporter (DMT)-like permease
MSAAVVLAVLAAAAFHAGWNALIRRRADRLAAVALLVAAAGTIAALALPFVGVPPAGAWPFLVASALIHVAYHSGLALAYDADALSRVYPLVRGGAPLFTLALSLLLLDEPVDAGDIAGVVAIAGGVMLLALERVGGAAPSPRALLAAGGTALAIAAYTLCDGVGARHAASGAQYVLWLYALHALPMLGTAFAFRGAALLPAFGAKWRSGLLGGALSLAAYGIAVWAMTVAPIPLVAALRETSILFAVAIGAVFLGERLTRLRMVAVAVVLVGLLLMRL